MNGGLQRIAHFLNQNPQRSEQLFHLNYFTIIYLLFKLTLDTFDGIARSIVNAGSFSLTYGSASLAFVLPYCLADDQTTAI